MRASRNFDIEFSGSIVLVRALSRRARRWIADNVHSEPWQWLGTTLAVDRRFAEDLIAGLEAA